MFRNALFAAALVVSTSAVAAPPRVFLTNAIRGDNSEITLGELVAARGSTAQVRSFGRTLSRDHSTARAQAASVARFYGMRAPTSMSASGRSAERRLRTLRGRAFDREVRRSMINDHRAAISMFSRQSRVGDRRTATLARRQLPVLQRHLRMAQLIRG